jgi:hypothetical protein
MAVPCGLVNKHSAGNFMSNEEMLGSQEGLCSKELVTKIY